MKWDGFVKYSLNGCYLPNLNIQLLKNAQSYEMIRKYSFTYKTQVLRLNNNNDMIHAFRMICSAYIFISPLIKIVVGHPLKPFIQIGNELEIPTT